MRFKYMYLLLILAVIAGVVAGPCSAAVVSKKVYSVAEVTYLHSNGDTPAPDEMTPDGKLVVLPLQSNIFRAKGVIHSPDSVFGFKATFVNTAVIMTWRQVVRYNNDTLGDINITKYVIYRAGEDRNFAFFAEVDSQTFSCTDLTPPTVAYYKVVAVEDMDKTSGYSLVLDNNRIAYVFRGDIDTSRDTFTRLVVPAGAQGIIYGGGDYDLHLEAARDQADEGKSQTIGGTKGNISTSISFKPYRYKNREQLASLGFPEKVQIMLRYEIDDKGLIKNTTLPASKAKDKLGFYYYNGIEWVKIPATLDQASQTLVATVSHLSKYALIAGFTNPTALTLTKRIPPIITPNADGINDRCFFYYDGFKAGTTPSLKIFDLSGSLVAEVTQVIPGQMEWDGKDMTGAVMDSGIYVYQIQAGDEIITGSVVLAK